MIRNAIITGASLEIDRGVFLSSWVQVDYGGTSQGFGGWALYLLRTSKGHQIQSPAGHWICRVMEIAGVESWDKVVGKSIRCRIEGDLIKAIGHIVKEDWFEPRADFAERGDTKP